MIDVRFRPISTWPGTRTSAHARKGRYTFKAPWSDTLDLIDRELRALAARNIVIEVALRDDQIRLDGWPRADATPNDPGVIVNFDSKHGPLRYATDVFSYWQHNVRAIALGLEALRKVDRYGITKRGEQYTGWRALPPGIALGPAARFDTREEAATFILAAAGEDPNFIDDMLVDAELTRDFYRTAAKKLHPDAGGTTEDFQRLQEAWQMIGGGAA